MQYTKDHTARCFQLYILKHVFVVHIMSTLFRGTIFASLFFLSLSLGRAFCSIDQSKETSDINAENKQSAVYFSRPNKEPWLAHFIWETELYTEHVPCWSSWVVYEKEERKEERETFLHKTSKKIPVSMRY